MMDEEKFERLLLRLGLMTFLIDVFPKSIINVGFGEEKKDVFSQENRKLTIEVTFEADPEIDNKIAEYFTSFIDNAKRKANFIEKEKDTYGV